VNDAMVKLLDGNTFVVSDQSGDIEATSTDPTGLFAFDTRFLSTWVLTVGGTRLCPLSVDDLEYFETKFFCVPGPAAVYLDAQLSVARQRTVCDGFVEDIVVVNHAKDIVDLRVRIDAASDFADLFDVKNNTQKKGTYLSQVEDGQLVLGYQRETFCRETVIRTDQLADIDEHGLTFQAHIEPQQRWTAHVKVTPTIVQRGKRQPLVFRSRAGRTSQDIKTELEQWRSRAPTLRSDWEPLKQIYDRSLTDLAALRFSPEVAGGSAMPAAGLPWFMSMFGRDSIITNIQAIAFLPELAAATIQVLARWQGSVIDDFRSEDPGRILHELRYGESAAFGRDRFFWPHWDGLIWLHPWVGLGVVTA